MCWYAVKKLRTHSPPVGLTQSWTCRFFCCQKWTGLEVESQEKLWLKTHSPIPPLIFTVVKSTKFGLNFRPSRPWGTLVLKRTTYRKPETNLRVSMTRLCPLRLGDVPSCTQLWQVKISRTILLREKMPEKNCWIINDSAADYQILLKFGEFMQCGSAEAAESFKSTSDQIQEGRQRPN